MTEFLSFDIETDPDTLAQDAFEYLADRVPGYVPADGNLDTWLIEACARMAAEVRDVAASVPTAVFRGFGQAILGIAPTDASYATATSTWTMRDASGYTVPDGTLVALRDASGERVAFETTAAVTVAAGQTTAANVGLIAVEPGAAASGLSGTVELLDALDFVSGVALAAPTSGGADAEDDDAYLNRLVDALRLLAPRPILPADFAMMAKSVAGVGRATAIDGYNPANGSTGNERMVAVAVADPAGEVVASNVRTTVDALLQGRREVNFVVNVIDPTYTTVPVTFSAVAYPDFDATNDVTPRAIQAVRDYLSPATFGTPDSGDEANQWLRDTAVRYLEIASVLNAVEGLNYITALQVNGGTADVALAGVAPLPRAGAIAGTVVAP